MAKPKGDPPLQLLLDIATRIPPNRELVRQTLRTVGAPNVETTAVVFANNGLSITPIERRPRRRSLPKIAARPQASQVTDQPATTTVFKGAAVRWRDLWVLPFHYFRHETGDVKIRPLRRLLCFLKAYAAKKFYVLLFAFLGAFAQFSPLENTQSPPNIRSVDIVRPADPPTAESEKSNAPARSKRRRAKTRSKPFEQTLKEFLGFE